jgi:hypothetical protein
VRGRICACEIESSFIRASTHATLTEIVKKVERQKVKAALALLGG